MGTLEHGLLYEFGGFRLEPRQRVLLDADLAAMYEVSTSA